MSGRTMLPLFHVRKSGLRSTFNERTLIFLLLGSSIFTLWLIFKNLPSNVVSDVEIKKIFIPDLNNIKNPVKVPVINDDDSVQHSDTENRGEVLPEPNIAHADPAKRAINLMRRDTVKNVHFSGYNF